VQSRADKIQSELKLLEWHKLANDAALKAALMQTKSLREDVPPIKPKHVAEDAKWIKKVIEEEHMKSLKVTKDYVMDFERKEIDQQERHEEQLVKHVDTLSKLRGRLEAKVELKKTTNKYREFQRQFAAKKWAIMKGATLDDLEAEGQEIGPATDGPLAGAPGAHIPQASDLTNVLNSLNKLAHLEKRITSLESNNEYEKMTRDHRTPAQERTSFEFKRQREIAAKGGPKQIVYTIKPKRTIYGSSSGAGVNAVRNRRANGGGGGGGGTFLTGGDFDGSQTNSNKPLSQKEREFARKKALATAPPGQKVLRGRLQAKKARGKEAMAANRRHQEAMDELARRKREQGSRQKGKQWASRIAAQKGASAGIKTNNRHLAEFQSAKKGFTKRREENAKRTLNRVNAKMKGKVSNFGVGSRTAPARGVRGKPSSSSMGRMTRRNQTGEMPTRRARTGGEVPLPTGPVAVNGIGGLRALRGQRVGNVKDSSRNSYGMSSGVKGRGRR